MPITVEIAAFALLAGCSLGAWIAIERRWRSHLPLLAHEPRAAVPWRFADLAIIVLFSVLAQFALVGAVQAMAGLPAPGLPEAIPGREATPANLPTVPLLAASSVARLLALAFGLVWLRISAGASWTDLGWRPDRLTRDVRVGLVAFAAVSVPLFVLQAALTHFFPTQHPLVQLLQQRRETALFAVSFVSAVIVAPVAEEFLFRLVMQGWLESFTPGRRPAEDSHQAPTALKSSEENGNPYRSPVHPDRPLPNPPPAMGPIVLTSLAFALMHWGHGPAPFALFWFSLVLGYLYQRTHRVAASIAAHAALNAFTLGVLWLSGSA